ncbi:MAG: phosphomannomutase, partial [Proteobacteria bacterium]
MKFPASIFRENDIRGIAGKDLSESLAYQIGLGYAAVLKRDMKTPGKGRTRHQIAVGRDCRLTSDSYAEALRNGLRDAGLDVVDLGTCPSPVTYFANFHFDLDGAIMVTGSHNPSDYNGFKISLGKNSLYGKQITELKDFVENEVKGSTRGDEKKVDIIPLYIDHLV